MRSGTDVRKVICFAGITQSKRHTGKKIQIQPGDKLLCHTGREIGADVILDADYF
jgi:hypothetical protein